MAANVEIDRTSPLGLFHYAQSYWQSGVNLAALNLKVTHPAAPVTFLLCHAIELYLKAYLCGMGRDLGFLRKIGHRVAEAAKAAREAGLVMDAADIEILSHIDEADVALEARYIETGFKRELTGSALAAVAERLDKSVYDALKKLGFAVRDSTFESPKARSGDHGAETEKVMIHLFKANDDSRGNKTMAHFLKMEAGMLEYHLDRLREAGYADSGIGNYMTDEWFWSLTPEGRRYVVEHKLV